MEIRVYAPEPAIKNPKKLFLNMSRDLIRGRELAWQLAVRDISAQYRQSVLGILWAFILPLANTIIWIFLNGSGIVNIGQTDIPYPVFVFLGTMLWAIFTESLLAPLQQSNAAKSIFVKINFPKESIILSGVYQVIFNGGIKIVLIIISLLFLGIYPGYSFVLLPAAFLVLVITGTAIGLLLTPVGLLFTDVGKGLPLLLQFLMYTTPVVYPMPQGGWVEKLVSVNPLTPLIMTCRALFTGGEINDLVSFAWISVFFLCLLIVAWIIYRMAIPVVIERMSS